MCMTCGCGETESNGHGSEKKAPHQGHSHSHRHLQGVHEGPMLGPGVKKITVEADLLQKNNHIAAHNRESFAERKILALNLVSSPGAGKTTLLEKTLMELKAAMLFSVIEGDQQTDNDARRIEATGAAVIQITTGQVCHLDAQMVHDAFHRMNPPEKSVLMIENVGNLVCPALFDLGEAAKVVIASTTEGEDKPVKYPYMFQAADLVLLNKIDLLPHVAFDTGRFEAYLRKINPKAACIPISATAGEGLHQWYAWLDEKRAIK